MRTKKKERKENVMVKEEKDFSYETPHLEISRFSYLDVIATSGGGEDGDDVNSGGWT